MTDDFEDRFDRLLDRMRAMHAERVAANLDDDFVWRISTDFGTAVASLTMLGHSVFADPALPPRSVLVLSREDALALPAADFERVFRLPAGFLARR